jgi:hypothetical protein
LLNFNDLSKLLEGSDEEFASFRDEADGEVSSYRDLLARLPSMDRSLLDIKDVPGRTGARPLEPMGDGFFVPFRMPWTDRDGCMRWMDEVLGKRKVAAVDGGQIYPERASGVPVAVLQAGVALNDRGNGLRREGRLSIIGPREFVESVFMDMPVNSLVDARRFELECDSAVSLMEEHDDVMVLMDYPLLVPHLLGYQDRLRYTYLHAVKRLLRTSGGTGDPVVGFVDRSVARDLTVYLYNLSTSGDTPAQERVLGHAHQGDAPGQGRQPR